MGGRPPVGNPVPVVFSIDRYSLAQGSEAESKVLGRLSGVSEEAQQTDEPIGLGNTFSRLPVNVGVAPECELGPGSLEPLLQDSVQDPVPCFPASVGDFALHCSLRRL